MSLITTLVGTLLFAVLGPVGGVAVPFVAIKALDMLMVAVGVA